MNKSEGEETANYSLSIYCKKGQKRFIVSFLCINSNLMNTWGAGLKPEAC